MNAIPRPDNEASFHADPVSRQTFNEVMVPTYAPSDMVPVRAQGLDLWDQQGKQYLDLTAGIAVTGLGHSHPAVVEALRAQADKLWHVGNGYTNEPVLQLARALTEATFADRAFFCNSGAEANEAAFKLARKYAHTKFGPHKSRIVSCVNSFHGRTLFTVSIGGQPKYTEGFEPLPEQLSHVPFNDIEAARAAIDDDVCAVVVEPVQGEGGVLPADPAYLKALREFCDARGALLIFDEVQCGMGRTGKLFAYMGYDVTPDILTSAKALGNGYPVAAMLTTESIAAAFSVGSHGTTYGGNPLAATVALRVLQIVNTPAFLARVNQAAELLVGKLNGVVRDYPQIFSLVRGSGLMLGMVLADSYRGKAKDIIKAAEAQGLMVLIAGPDVVRLLPALVISDAQIDEGIARMRAALDALVTPQ
ncbi:acetylornithine/succinylornithine family transaminase [Noviherbaspirillum sp. Root189]|uniref:acetylornithine/succinylornithine family transaminase n=1 Tax=Noviherbaspirillum sp. Root189 TaxID=1736487 RepID=UPI00070D388A|nr:acetylornithine/succinylornithine family transaminase [Noviherbaspirillum sp. Root189]KRB84645.1 acetylornithine aminotransferase [Noviherbaspirillum sp. Root189]